MSSPLAVAECDFSLMSLLCAHLGLALMLKRLGLGLCPYSKGRATYFSGMSEASVPSPRNAGCNRRLFLPRGQKILQPEPQETSSLGGGSQAERKQSSEHTRGSSFMRPGGGHVCLQKSHSERTGPSPPLPLGMRSSLLGPVLDVSWCKHCVLSVFHGDLRMRPTVL